MPRFRDIRDKEKGKTKSKPKKQPKQTKKSEEKIEGGEKTTLQVTDPYSILKFVLMTEKCVRMIETDNRLVFIVDRNANKNIIKCAFESAFGSKVLAVNTVVDQKSRKKAFIKLKDDGAAGDIAVRLGII
ncbi:MAG: 50S ribosomal protein L23 [Candidatus Aenigmatarchaeota archaeon]